MSDIISRTFQMTNIKRVNFSALGTIRLVQGDEEIIIVEGTEEALEHVKISQEDDTALIKLYTWYDFLFIPRPAVYTIKVKHLESFNISGSAEMDCESMAAGESDFSLTTSGSGQIRMNTLQARNLTISSSGSGNYAIHAIETKQVKAGISGSGNFSFDGAAASLSLHISGSGDINAAGLAVETADAHISGAGKIAVQVSQRLDVHISGSGEVIYSGSPQVTQSISGSGKIRQR